MAKKQPARAVAKRATKRPTKTVAKKSPDAVLQSATEEPPKSKCDSLIKLAVPDNLVDANNLADATSSDWGVIAGETLFHPILDYSSEPHIADLMEGKRRARADKTSSTEASYALQMVSVVISIERWLDSLRANYPGNRKIVSTLDDCKCAMANLKAYLSLGWSHQAVASALGIATSIMELSSLAKQSAASAKGNQSKKAASNVKREAAIEELLRRINSNPNATKTSHIEKMAKARNNDGTLQWGARGLLIEWCRDIKSPKSKTGNVVQDAASCTEIAKKPVQDGR